jgi:hypothetical protein
MGLEVFPLGTEAVKRLSTILLLSFCRSYLHYGFRAGSNQSPAHSCANIEPWLWCAITITSFQVPQVVIFRRPIQEISYTRAFGEQVGTLKKENSPIILQKFSKNTQTRHPSQLYDWSCQVTDEGLWLTYKIWLITDDINFSIK